MRHPRSWSILPSVAAPCALALLLLSGAPDALTAPVPAAPPVQPAATPQLTLQQVFQQSSPAVVLLRQFDAGGKWTSLGSGFIVSPTGLVVTNNHVIKPDPGAVRIAVTLPARGDTFQDVRLIYTETERDFALLSIKADGLPFLKVADSDQVHVGDQVAAIGNPLDPRLSLTFTVGYVEAIRLRPGTDYLFIQHQAPITPGNSGGPLLNLRGEVIGINTFNFRNAQNINGAIPINYVKPYLGDPVVMTWIEYARAHAAPPPGAAQPAAPPAPAAAVMLPVALVVPSASQPALAGGREVLIVRTETGAVCTGVVVPAVTGAWRSTFGKVTADPKGDAVFKGLFWGAKGRRDLTVTCKLGDRTGTLQTSFEVQ